MAIKQKLFDMGKFLKVLAMGGVAGSASDIAGGESHKVRHLEEYLIVTLKAMRYQQMLKVVQK